MTSGVQNLFLFHLQQMTPETYSLRCKELGITQSFTQRDMPPSFQSNKEPTYLVEGGHNHVGPRVAPYELEDLTALNPHYTSRKGKAIRDYIARMTPEEREAYRAARKNNGKAHHAEKIKHR